MKLQKIIQTVLLVAVIALLAVGLAACSGEPELEKIEVEGYREDFFVGDTFETGTDFAVYAVYSDGNRERITDGYNIKHEAGFDMYVVGDYMITVEYGGKKAVYTVYVNEADSELRKLSVDTSGMKSRFVLGDTFEFAGLRLTATYANASGRDIVITYDNLSKFTVTVTDADGNVAEHAFEEFGKYTVTISSGKVAASFEVNVEDVDLETVGNAIYAAKYGHQYVNSGTLHKIDTIAASKTSDYEFTFGDNYTYIKSMQESEVYGMGVTEDHYSLDLETGKIIAAKLNNGVPAPSTTYVPEAMNGVPVGLWWQETTEYGMEAVIANLYKRGYPNSNGDYVETVDKDSMTYTFSYSYRLQRTTGVKDDDYFFINTVSFTLGEKYAIKNASMKQVLYYTGFSLDENGYTKLDEGAKAAYTLEITMEQTVGEKTAQNPYGGDSLVIKDFDLFYDGAELTAEDVIYGNAGMDITIRIDNLQPGTTSLESDMPYFSDGVREADATIFTCDGFAVYRRGNIINIKLSGGGEWDLVITTKNVTKHVKLNITGAAPTKLTTEVYQSAFNAFAETPKVTPMVGVPVYFRAMPNDYANGSCTAEIIGDAEGTELKKAQINGVDCWVLTTTKAGTYEVVMTSTEAADVTCQLKVVVVDVPELDTLLDGTYTAVDTEDGVYKLTFKQTADAAITSGTVSVEYTTADGKTEKEELKFAVSDSDLTLILEPESTLGVDIKVNASGKLVIEDKYGATYTLTKEA